MEEGALLFFLALHYTPCSYSDNIMTNYEKPDYWTLKAQKEGYPARSVYKLMEIDEKFKLFQPAPGTPILRVLDLGAAPGSWSLYVLRRYGKQAGNLILAAIDLEPLPKNNELSGREEYIFIQGDFTKNPVREEIFRRRPYNAIISDAAPLTTGSKTVDTLRSLSLAEEVVSLAEDCLVPGGNLALKIFQGGNSVDLLKQMRKRFNSAKSFKPAACRANSFETYYIGLGKKE